jgi:hypothetical protein
LQHQLCCDARCSSCGTDGCQRGPSIDGLPSRQLCCQAAIVRRRRRIGSKSDGIRPERCRNATDIGCVLTNGTYHSSVVADPAAGSRANPAVQPFDYLGAPTTHHLASAVPLTRPSYGGGALQHGAQLTRPYLASERVHLMLPTHLTTHRLASDTPLGAARFL